MRAQCSGCMAAAAGECMFSRKGPSAMCRCLEDYDLHKQLYRGKASLLYHATCKLSGLPVALKLYRKHKLSELNWYQVLLVTANMPLWKRWASCLWPWVGAWHYWPLQAALHYPVV